MDTLVGRLPEIITAAAQSYLGILALLSIALAVLAYFFFAKASEKVKVGIFVLLFIGVIAFGAAMFRVEKTSAEGTPSPVELSNEAKTLLQKSARDPGGTIFFERYGDGVDLRTNGESLVTSKADHEALATWEAALDELVKGGLLIAHGERREVFEITKQGYAAAKRLEDSARIQ